MLLGLCCCFLCWHFSKRYRVSNTFFQGIALHIHFKEKTKKLLGWRLPRSISKTIKGMIGNSRNGCPLRHGSISLGASHHGVFASIYRHVVFPWSKATKTNRGATLHSCGQADNKDQEKVLEQELSCSHGALFSFFYIKGGPLQIPSCLVPYFSAFVRILRFFHRVRISMSSIFFHHPCAH